jgi:hypothetical protein
MGTHLFIKEEQLLKAYSPRVIFVSQYEYSNQEERKTTVLKSSIGVIMPNNMVVVKNSKGMREYIPYRKIRNYVAREVILFINENPDMNRILDAKRNSQQLWSNLHKVYSFKLMAYDTD